MKVTVDVTQADIDAGCRCASLHCPVARALNRLLKPTFAVAVTYAEIMVYKDDGFVRSLPIPSRLVSFMAEFDITSKSNAPKPFSLDMDIPEEFVCQ